jgi:hypothetical protein
VTHGTLQSGIAHALRQTGQASFQGFGPKHVENRPTLRQRNDPRSKK